MRVSQALTVLTLATVLPGTILPALVAQKNAPPKVPAGKEKLLATWRHLSALPSADKPFAKAQRAVWALDNDLEGLAWPLVASLAASPKRPAVYGQLIRLALPKLFPNLAAQRGELPRGRVLLQAVTRAQPGPRGQARDLLARQEILRLLAAEKGRLAKTKRKPARTLRALCRTFAEDGVGENKRRVARRTLLDLGAGERKYVFRMTMRYPLGRRCAAVLSDIRACGYVEEAGTYLGKVTERVAPSLMARGVGVLGALGSANALPMLHRLRSRIGQNRQALRRAGKGGGGAPHANIAILNQRSYVKDFDVEIASSAFIADPIVGVVNSGVVLDVKLVSVDLYRFLNRLERAVDRAIGACGK